MRTYPLSALPAGGGVYLLHLSKPLGNPLNSRGMARHYLGFTDSYQTRLEQHRRGAGAALLRAAKLADIDFSLARVWPGATRAGERKLKDQHNARRLCPICQGEGRP